MSTLATRIYSRNLRSSNRISKVFWSLSRTMLIKLLNDPDCIMPIHGQYLAMPLSHPLPLYIKNFKFYDRLPSRIGQFMRRKYGHVKCVDVGANIGDTVASLYLAGADKDRFLVIEPNETFQKYLLRNCGAISNVKILPVVCSSENSSKNYKVEEGRGTASFIHDSTGKSTETKCLDDILSAEPEFSNLNILKIDTDGHDFKVIAGAKQIIQKNLPAVLFECDLHSNTDYVEDCLRALKFFGSVGYKEFLFYDNFGNLMGRSKLSDLSNFKNLLFYQITSKFCYFDILLMRDEDLRPFLSSEIKYFVDNIENEALKRAAAAATDW